MPWPRPPMHLGTRYGSQNFSEVCSTVSNQLFFADVSQVVVSWRRSSDINELTRHRSRVHSIYGYLLAIPIWRKRLDVIPITGHQIATSFAHTTTAVATTDSAVVPCAKLYSNPIVRIQVRITPWGAAEAAGLASWRLTVFSVRAPIQVLNHVLNQIVWNTLSQFMLYKYLILYIYYVLHVFIDFFHLLFQYSYFSSCTMIFTCVLLYLMMCMLCRRLTLILSES